MQILYIIGNGFDLNLEMKTKFIEFCDFYQKTESKTRVLKSLKSNIKKKINTWADLEKRLGEYTLKMKSEKDFDIIFDDLILNLGIYLQIAEDEVDFLKVNKEKLFEYFCKPEKELQKKDVDEIRNLKTNWTKHHWYVDIMTFNYTRTIERLFGQDIRNIEIGNHHGTDARIYLQNIYHVHGFLDDGIILGINDISQLKNEKFHTQQRILNSIIKPENNKLQRKGIDDDCIAKISQANIICIYGSSIGDTDNFWWEQIGRRLLDNCELIIYTKGDEVPASLGHKKAQIGLYTKDIFLNKTNLSAEEKEKIKNKIHMGANTDMFGKLLKN